MNLIRTNLRTIIILALLVLGLIVTLYLVKNPQVFKSRADATKFQITGRDGTEANYENGKFTTTSDHITIGIKDILQF